MHSTNYGLIIELTRADEDCRYKERIAIYNQCLKAEGKTHRFMALHLVPSSACNVCTCVLSQAKRLPTVAMARIGKWTKSLSTRRMVGSEAALRAFWGMMKPMCLKECSDSLTL